MEVTVIRRGGLILCEKPEEEVKWARQNRDEENLQMLQDVAWTGQADPNLPRIDDSSVGFERVTSFKD